MTNDKGVDISHDPGSEVFEARVDGQRAFLEYRREGNVIDIRHTNVPKEIGGRGVAGQLMASALAFARQAGLRVRPSCSYAQAYMDRHPADSDLRV